jgi:hypothetical protein
MENLPRKEGAYPKTEVDTERLQKKYKHSTPNIMTRVNTIPVFYTFFSDFLAIFLKFFTIFYDQMWTLEPEHSPSDIMTTVSTMPLVYSNFHHFFLIF